MTNVETMKVTGGTVRRSFRKLILKPTVCSMLASTGIFGGISALFIGLVCVVMHAILGHEHNFDRVGTVLLVAAIPMILVGSIFLDEIERKEK